MPNVVTDSISRESLKFMPTVSLNGEVGGYIEGQPSDAEIQSAVNRMNTDLSALKDIATNLKAGDHIIDISPLLEDGRAIGYTINFHEGLPITIFYEKDDNNAVYSKLPDIGILKDTDGEYYWSLEWQDLVCLWDITDKRINRQICRTVQWTFPGYKNAPFMVKAPFSRLMDTKPLVLSSEHLSSHDVSAYM